MKNLARVLFLGLILCACTEYQSPDKLESESNLKDGDLIEGNVIQVPALRPSGNPETLKINATFTPIDDVTGSYLPETTLIDFSLMQCTFWHIHGLSSGSLYLNFDRAVSRRCQWVFCCYPDVEDILTPPFLFSNGHNTVGMKLSKPVSTFGFQLDPNAPGFHEVQADFYSEGNLIGSVIKTVGSEEDNSIGSKLFAASSDALFDYIVVEGKTLTSGFSMAQFRYVLPKEKNLFTLDIKPGSCENPVNVNSRGVLPVALLSHQDFDVNDIDISTIQINSVPVKRTSIADIGGFYDKESVCDCVPTERDGVMDLDLKFDTQEIISSLWYVKDSDDRATLNLTFKTKDGKSWLRQDCIRIIKNKGGR